MHTQNLPLINSHNSWSQLEEVWLGDVYPISWYSHLDSQVRDVFQQLTEITQQDLDVIQKTLESFDVVVQRPAYDCIDNYLDTNGQLFKPQICPRDHYVVIGNRLIGPRSMAHEHFQLSYNSIKDASWPDVHTPEQFNALPDAIRQECVEKFNVNFPGDPFGAWQHVIDQYLQDSRCRFDYSPAVFINGANIVRVGRDIIIDCDIFDYVYDNAYPEYRVHLVKNGGHMDGCFAILKPGLILANHYFEDYDRTFPGWEIIYLDNPTYHAAPSTGYQQPYPVYNGKFFDTTVGTNGMFNDHVIQHALDWVGNYTETYFELNCLVINETNVIMLAENHQLAQDLERHGITVHWVPFRARSFWDGAMHCLTVDIRRQSTIQDFFPERQTPCSTHS
jgi:hypothetical protein